MITLDRKENGLLITLTDREAFIARFPDLQPDVFEVLEESGYSEDSWSDCTGRAGLTDSPIFRFGGDDSDELGTADEGEYYWYPDYMVMNPWAVLAHEGSVFFPKG